MHRGLMLYYVLNVIVNFRQQRLSKKIALCIYLPFMVNKYFQILNDFVNANTIGTH